MNVYLTGDTHGRFERIACFCRDNRTTREDVLIILGDAGVNYYINHRDEKLKQYIATMPITLLASTATMRRGPRKRSDTSRLSASAARSWRSASTRTCSSPSTARCTSLAAEAASPSAARTASTSTTGFFAARRGSPTSSRTRKSSAVSSPRSPAAAGESTSCSATPRR